MNAESELVSQWVLHPVVKSLESSFISFSSESGIPTTPICECKDIRFEIVTFYWTHCNLLYNLAMIPKLITQPLLIL